MRPHRENCKGNPMAATTRFLRTTIVGGAFFLMPIVVLIYLLNKAFDFARRGLKPVAKVIPDQLVSGTTMEAIMAIVLIALLCFLAGLFARTLLAQKITSELESAVLSKVPAYDYLKQAGSSMMGLGEVADHPVVLAQLGGAWRLGVQTDTVADGLAAVFVPNSPNTFSGSVFFIASEKVQPLDVPLAGALRCLERCGVGGRSLLGNLSLAAVARR
jgi:uncharacterized membrane protein